MHESTQKQKVFCYTFSMNIYTSYFKNIIGDPRCNIERVQNTTGNRHVCEEAATTTENKAADDWEGHEGNIFFVIG